MFKKIHKNPLDTLRRQSVYYFGLLIVTVIYFGLRFVYPGTIEFGYDQPRLAYTVLDFIKNGNFLTAQSYSLPTAWGNLSWGPALVFFNAFFLSITKDPLHVSYLMIIFNYLSIVIVFVIGSKFFSQRVGFMAALIFSVHPWWIVFSRMIYQPTPIPVFISFSILFLFKLVSEPKSRWIVPLVLSWMVLLQMYLITFSFVFTSVLILLFTTKGKINYRYLLVSLVFVIFLSIPSAYYYFQNPDMFTKFLTFGDKFNTSLSDALEGFIATISGGNFRWQLGYGYKDFVSSFWQFSLLQTTTALLIILTLVLGFKRTLVSQNSYGLMLFLFLVAPLWAIPLVGVELVVPRYYLYILPSFSLALALSFDYIVSKIGYFYLIALFFVLIFWTVFIFKYFHFVKGFDYPSGYLSNWSDVPYSYLSKSIEWIRQDAKKKGYDSYSINLEADSLDNENFSYSERYYVEYVLKRDSGLVGKVGNYRMHFTPVDEKVTDYQRFGPYVVYENLTSQDN